LIEDSQALVKTIRPSAKCFSLFNLKSQIFFLLGHHFHCPGSGPGSVPVLPIWIRIQGSHFNTDPHGSGSETLPIAKALEQIKSRLGVGFSKFIKELNYTGLTRIHMYMVRDVRVSCRGAPPRGCPPRCWRCSSGVAGSASLHTPAQGSWSPHLNGQHIQG